MPGTRGLLPVLALLLAACAAPRVVEFSPVPEADAGRVRNVHAFGATSLCQGCHVRGDPAPALKTVPIALCTGCHRQAHGNHPVDVAVKEGADGLPLWQGRIACTTCHDPHAVRTAEWLRGGGLKGNALCLRCHQKHGKGKAG